MLFPIEMYQGFLDIWLISGLGQEMDMMIIYHFVILETRELLKTLRSCLKGSETSSRVSHWPKMANLTAVGITLHLMQWFEAYYIRVYVYTDSPKKQTHCLPFWRLGHQLIILRTHKNQVFILLFLSCLLETKELMSGIFT